jgi:hypothetical protein
MLLVKDRGVLAFVADSADQTREAQERYEATPQVRDSGVTPKYVVIYMPPNIHPRWFDAAYFHKIRLMDN